MALVAQLPTDVGNLPPEFVPGGSRWTPMFDDGDQALISELEVRAVALDPSYSPIPMDELGYVDTDGLPATLLDDLVEKYLVVSNAHPLRPPSTSPPRFSNLTPPLDLGLARFAREARALVEDLRTVLVIEQGWWHHDDLDPAVIGPLLGHAQDRFGGHGLKVLGLIAAIHNRKFINGAYAGNLRLTRCSEWRTATTYSPVHALLAGLAHCSEPGTVALYESQTLPSDVLCTNDYCQGVPIEFRPEVWFGVRLASALGVAVVECAGNAALDLDFLGYGPFDPSERDRDSGAIIVGGVDQTGSVRDGNSCYGSRVDCCAASQRVLSLYRDKHRQDVAYFSGTSAAGAILAGAAALLQTASIAIRGRPFPTAPQSSEPTLRDVMRSSGTPVDGVGNLPDLQEVARVHLAIV